MRPADSGASTPRAPRIAERRKNIRTVAAVPARGEASAERTSRALERDTLLTGELVPRAGGSFHAYKEHPTQLGFDSGDDAFLAGARRGPRPAGSTLDPRRVE